METHQVDGRTGVPYRFSYTMNMYMNSEAPPPGAPAGYEGKHWNRGQTPRVTSINRAAEKILVVEENERTINDGLWVPGNYPDPQNRTSTWAVNYDYLSVRHDTRKAEFNDPRNFAGRLLDQTKRGNVLFVDGHVDFVTRRLAHSPQNVLPVDEGTGKVPTGTP
jgi:prepilin-type processing-associated H-X9-DG protein